MQKNRKILRKNNKNKNIKVFKNRKKTKFKGKKKESKLAKTIIIIKKIEEIKLKIRKNKTMQNC